MKKNMWLLVLAFACSFSKMAEAGLIQYVTPNSSQTGAPGSVHSVSGEADFTLGNGTLTLTLQNYTADPIADTQMISGIKFNVSGASAETLTSALGKTGTINGGGTLPTSVSSSPVTLDHWQASESGTQIYVNTFSGGKPNQLIIGPGDASGKYNNANPSITGHEPSVLNSATFTFNITGVTALSTLSNVSLIFGTDSALPSYNLVTLVQSSSSQPSSVPEPSSFALLGIGGLAMAIELIADAECGLRNSNTRIWRLQETSP